MKDRPDPKPSLRLTVTAMHTESQLTDAAQVIVKSLDRVLTEVSDDESVSGDEVEE